MASGPTGPAGLAEPAGAGGALQAAGAVLVRRDPAAGLLLGLVHRPRYDDWSLPKGKLDRGEHPLVAAVREVREETGCAVALGRPLPVQRYLVAGAPKEVRYWVGAPLPGRDGAFTPTREVDALDWLPPGEALARLTHPRDGDIVAAMLAAPVATTPLVLLRHATAVPRAGWSAADALRPLDAAGAAHAEQLAGVLAAYGPLRLLSSDSVRCLETVRPLARRWRRAVEADPGWSEQGYLAGRAAAVARATRLVAAGEPALVCSHRPVLPELLAGVCRRFGVPAPPTGLAPGGFAVLHCAEGRVVAVETHPG